MRARLGFPSASLCCSEDVEFLEYDGHIFPAGGQLSKAPATRAVALQEPHTPKWKLPLVSKACEKRLASLPATMAVCTSVTLGCPNSDVYRRTRHGIAISAVQQLPLVGLHRGALMPNQSRACRRVSVHFAGWALGQVLKAGLGGFGPLVVAHCGTQNAVLVLLF